MLKFITLNLFILSLVISFSSAQAQGISKPQVVKAIHHDTSMPLRDVVETLNPQTSWKDGIVPIGKPFPDVKSKYQADESLQLTNGTNTGGTIGQNFDGIAVGTGGIFVAPPDVTCDVGPNHVMQMVNSAYQIWDKSGNSLLGPFTLSTIWSGFAGPWASSLNDGDPVVLYDQLADRWFASEFSLPNGGAGPEYLLIAVSQTSDPTGAWYRYGFAFPQFPDYPHYGIWPDGYYVSVNRFAPGFTGTYAAAFERDSMLIGGIARMILFTNSPSVGDSFLPSDWDGSTAPPTGAPNYFTAAGSNSLRIYEFHVDWVTTANSTFIGPLVIPTSPFSFIDDIQQLGTLNTLSGVSPRLMQRLQYRNFGTYQTMVTSHNIDAGGSRAGVRWYELRNTIAGWILFQEGTYAPADGLERWMGSIAMNADGDIALGYSVSSSMIYPEIRYTGRRDGDPLGTMTIAEGTIHAGLGSQTGTLNRWGDYSQMSVDPTDDLTFWYSTEYIPVDGTFNWNTRIASFAFGPPCLVGFPATPSPANGAAAVDVNIGQVTWTNGTGATSIEVFFGEAGNMVSVYLGTPVTSYSFGVLNYSTTYNWKVNGSDGSCTTSGPIWSFTTGSDPNIVCSFEDHFDADLSQWTEVGPMGIGNWLWSATNNAVGAASGELNFHWSPSFVGDSYLMSDVIPSTGITNLTIEFQHFVDWFADPMTVGLAYTTDSGTSWTSIWEITPTGNVGPELISLSNVMGDANFRLGFYWMGDSFNIDEWWIDDVTVCYIVPVELTSFAATVDEADVTLNWSTATETNNQGFEIQRSKADNEYEKIGYVPGHGTTTKTQTYSYTDSKVTSGNYSYRLKQIDYDGTTDYSDEVAIEVTAPLEFALEQNYPNPFNPSTLIKYSIPENGFVTLDVFNLLGEKVASLVNSVQDAGRYEINFDASELASGIYVYSLRSGSFNSVKKMLLMK